MKITVKDRDRSASLREKLRDRLDSVAKLRCSEHDRPVSAVTIHARENGWFDAQWITCCHELEKRAAAIMKTRC